MKIPAMLIFIMLLGMSVFGQPDSAKDTDLISNFVIDVIDKVKWPDNMNKDSLTILVVGNGNYSSELESAARAKNGRKVTIKSISANEKIENCGMVFIATDSLNHLAGILKQVENKPILTVSKHGTFARYGVMINIREAKNKKVKYALNNMTARHSKIEFNSELIAKAVETYGR